MIKRSNRMLRYSSASERSILSLQNWVHGNACLSRAETHYLLLKKDLVTLGLPSDGAMERVEGWVEDRMIQLSDLFQKVSPPPSLLE
jgi:hypothetical protein